MNAALVYTALTAAQIENALGVEHSPTILAFAGFGSVGHAVLIKGYRESGKELLVTVCDPGSLGEYTVKLSELPNSKTYGKWDATFTVSRN